MNARLTNLLTTLASLNPDYAGIGAGMLTHLITESKAMLEPASTTLPVIHTNGTGRATLQQGYAAAADKFQDFIDAWGAIEFNARDYYPLGPAAWEAARSERDDLNAKLRAVREHLDAIREHLHS